ncbi:YciI family protein [Pseudonocardia sp. CA-107938]|uniref:YciI family protein n=1 Tax=Pseudonocardia sp. CA-107938 TaxID=3240021 RepID=UPI003D89B66C
MEVVVFYAVREGVDRDRLMDVYPRHKSYYEEFHASGGGLIALGPFLAPDPAGGSMGIFRSREDAERFVAADPFVLEGLADPRIVEWSVVRFG